MQHFTDVDQFAGHFGPYASAAVPRNAFLSGWLLETATAVVCSTDNGPWLVIEGDASPLEYAQVLSHCVEQGTPVASIAVPWTLAERLSVDITRDWFWMVRQQPFPPLSLPTNSVIVTDGRMDAEISRFLQINAPQSAVLPGNPELQFWVVECDADENIIATAAGTEWNSGARVVNSVAVAVTARRRGLGGIVTRLAVQQHFGSGATSVSLGVRGSNRGAVEMYRKLGFEEHHFVSVQFSTLQPE